VGRLHQKCWPHLLRDVKEVDEGKENGDDWSEFRKRLRRIYGNAIHTSPSAAANRGDETSPLEVRRHKDGFSQRLRRNCHSRSDPFEFSDSGRECKKKVPFVGIEALH